MTHLRTWRLSVEPGGWAGVTYAASADEALRRTRWVTAEQVYTYTISARCIETGEAHSEIVSYRPERTPAMTTTPQGKRIPLLLSAAEVLAIYRQLRASAPWECRDVIMTLWWAYYDAMGYPPPPQPGQEEEAPSLDAYRAATKIMEEER